MFTTTGPPFQLFLIHHQLQRRLLALWRSRQFRRFQMLHRSTITTIHTKSSAEVQDSCSLAAWLNREAKNIPAGIHNNGSTSLTLPRTPPPLARAPSPLPNTFLPNIDEYVHPLEMFFAGQRTANAYSRPQQVGKFLRDLGRYLPSDGNGKTLFHPSCTGALHH